MNAATEAQNCTGLMFVEVSFEEVEDGMTLRLRREDEETIVGTVRNHWFSSIDSALVMDAVYPAARVDALFSPYENYQISTLVQS